jgi:hypothetical protein
MTYLSVTSDMMCSAPLNEDKAEVDKSDTTEGPFLAAFQPLTQDLIKTKSNLQLIDLSNNRVENLAEFSVANRLIGTLNIIGRAEKVKPERPGEETNGFSEWLVVFMQELL